MLKMRVPAGCKLLGLRGLLREMSIFDLIS